LTFSVLLSFKDRQTGLVSSSRLIPIFLKVNGNLPAENLCVQWDGFGGLKALKKAIVAIVKLYQPFAAKLKITPRLRSLTRA